MKFYDVFVAWCNSIKKKPARVALEIGISKATVSNWKTRGTNPTPATLQMIADYFGVTVPQLLDGPKKGKPTLLNEDGLTQMQKEAIDLILKLPPEELARFIRALKAYTEE